MASDVKWIKITTDIFDDEKIVLIESMPDAYAIITVWFKLLCLAGKQNNNGVLMLGRVAYTDDMLATIFRMNKNTVTLALETFKRFGMIEVVEGVITIPNWSKHQSLDALEKKKERNRVYMANRRAEQKKLVSGTTSSPTSSPTVDALSPSPSYSNSISNKEDKNKGCGGKEKEQRLTPMEVVAAFNAACPRLSPVGRLSKIERNTIISLQNNGYDLREVFRLVSESEFLNGENERGWVATFDWILDEENIVKILRGNYRNLQKEGGGKRGTDNASTEAERDAALKKKWNLKIDPLD